MIQKRTGRRKMSVKESFLTRAGAVFANTMCSIVARCWLPALMRSISRAVMHNLSHTSFFRSKYMNSIEIRDPGGFRQDAAAFQKSKAVTRRGSLSTLRRNQVLEKSLRNKGDTEIFRRPVEEDRRSGASRPEGALNAPYAGLGGLSALKAEC